MQQAEVKNAAKEPFKCLVCRARFVTNLLLRDHLKSTCREHARLDSWLESYISVFVGNYRQRNVNAARQAQRAILHASSPSLPSESAPSSLKRRHSDKLPIGPDTEYTCVFCFSVMRGTKPYKRHLKYTCGRHVETQLWKETYAPLLKVEDADKARQYAENAQANVLARSESAKRKHSKVIDRAANLEQIEPSFLSQEESRIMSESDQEDNLGPLVDEAILHGLSSHDSLLDIMLSENILIWLTWHTVEQILQAVQSTAELVLLSPLEVIQATVAEQLAKFTQEGKLSEDEETEMLAKWTDNDRFRSALQKAKIQGKDDSDNTPAQALKPVILAWATSMQSTFLRLADVVVAHAVEQEWKDSSNERVLKWQGDSASLSQLPLSDQQAMIGHLSEHWQHWRGLFMDMDTYLKYSASRLKRRVQKIRADYDNVVQAL